jgi:putative transposase
MVEFYINEHNTKMPHPAFSGQTPDEMFFGTDAKVPDELALAKGNARTARMAANRAMSCERCLGQQAPFPEGQIPS